MESLAKSLRHAVCGGGFRISVVAFVMLVVQARAHQPDVNLPVIDLILVTISSETITESDLQTYQVKAIRQRARSPVTTAALARVISEVTPGAIAAAVDETLMAQRARVLGYAFTDDMFEQFLSNARGVFRFQGQTEDFKTNEEVLKAIQKSERITAQEIRRMIERQMLAQQAMQIDILDQVNLTEAEAREYYNTHISEYTTPATATLREILIAAPNGEGDARAEDHARMLAETTVVQLRNGEDFSVLAAELSDSPSKANGGRVGPLVVTEYSQAIQELIAELEVGDVADPIRTAQGYQIVMLDLSVEVYVRPFDERPEEITGSVFGNRRTDMYNTLLQTLRNQAVIEWQDQDLRLAYESYRAANPEVQALPLR